MSDLTNVFTNIADAIRAKTETQITYKPTEMANAINNISSGGGALVYNANGVNITYWFNSPITIEDGVTNTFQMFLDCSNFNQPINIPNSVTNTVQMFGRCSSFNQLINIPNSVTNTVSMFFSCRNFNLPVAIPNSVTNTSQMFFNCFNFNQPVTIPNSVTDTSQMFFNCSSFNQPITIPNGVTDTSYMFPSCFNFNQPVTIPNGVTSVNHMFRDCRNFNQPVIIPNSVTSTAQMFKNCTSFGSNIYWYTNVQKTATKNMLANCNNSLAKHIFTNNTNAFNGTASSNSITATAITWTQDGANYYNTAYNIYIHNVANPYTIMNNELPYFGPSSPIPDSPAIVFGSGVIDLSSAFSFVELNSNNTIILFEEGVEDMTACFRAQSYFNQPLTIPSSAVKCSDLVSLCYNFNSPVVFRNGVKNISFALAECYNFEADLWIPESVTNMANLLRSTPYANGIVHISHNIALGDTSNYIYSAFTVISGEDGTESGLFVPLDPSRILNDY